MGWLWGKCDNKYIALLQATAWAPFWGFLFFTRTNFRWCERLFGLPPAVVHALRNSHIFKLSGTRHYLFSIAPGHSTIPTLSSSSESGGTFKYGNFNQQLIDYLTKSRDIVNFPLTIHNTLQFATAPTLLDLFALFNKVVPWNTNFKIMKFL